MSKEYDIHVKVTLYTTKRIEADSLECAAVAAQTLKSTDILPVKIVRDSIDTELDVEGVMRA